jgi:hypothetical protein
MRVARFTTNIKYASHSFIGIPSILVPMSSCVLYLDSLLHHLSFLLTLYAGSRISAQLLCRNVTPICQAIVSSYPTPNSKLLLATLSSSSQLRRKSPPSNIQPVSPQRLARAYFPSGKTKHYNSQQTIQ